jgi:hypothetical protein
MKDAAELKSHVWYFYDTDNREILTSDGNPFQSRQMGTGELARAPKASCFR